MKQTAHEKVESSKQLEPSHRLTALKKQVELCPAQWSSEVQKKKKKKQVEEETMLGLSQRDGILWIKCGLTEVQQIPIWLAPPFFPAVGHVSYFPALIWYASLGY